MESLLNNLTYESKNKMVDQLPQQQPISDSQTYNSVRSTLMHFGLVKLNIVLHSKAELE